MAYPKTFDELKAAQYRFEDHGKCRACGRDIEWWITLMGRKLPFNLMTNGSSPAVLRSATCENDGEYTRR
jgi:hypothetical protein